MNDEQRSGDSAGTEPVSSSLSIDPTLLELDHVFAALDHSRRRYLLYALTTEENWTLEELATKLAAWEEDVPEAAVHDDQRDRMYASLYHAHVPKLAAYNVIRFDREAETISRGDNAQQVLAALEGAGASLDSRQERHANRTYASDEEVNR